ncbi:MAG: class C sortase [Ruminococcaceae bacterium]|nr:class C sortase [Oscillospiraceae bacterium]
MKLNDGKTTALLFILFIAGLSLLLYPTVSDYWNSSRSTKAIMSYDEEVSKLEKQKYEQVWNDARSYNSSLIGRENDYLLSDEQQAQYNSLLDLTGTGIMGYIEIPNIRCSVPIYHGTEENVLQIAIGHLEWSSLPTGGESTHAVLSGHRGLPSARLFSDLDKIVEGDTFMLRILDEVLTYEVDKISIVEPHETEELKLQQGKDYCTLVTCTPYGVNSHRLLVRGHRVENLKKTTITLVSEAQQIDPLIVAPAIAAPVLMVLFARLMMPAKRKGYKDE